MANKWVDKVTDICSVSDWIIDIKVLVPKIISRISAYATPCGLHDNQKDNFINAVRTLGKKEIVVITGNGHVGNNAEDYEDQQK